MLTRKTASATSAAALVAGLSTLGATANASDVTMYVLPSTAPMSAAAIAGGRSILPMLTDISQVPKGAGTIVQGSATVSVGSAGSPTAAKAVTHGEAGLSDDELDAPRGYGTGNHPFTTKGAYSTFVSTPVELHPWRPSGKLSFQRSGSFICSASLIKRGLLVTAAHCVNTFGTNIFNSSTSFQPARHGASTPYGTIAGTNIWVPTVYRNGTDECTTAGVVCANDVAVVRLASNIGNTTGWYAYGVNGYGYTNSLFLTKNAAQITQLGYPGAFESGLKMIRTDALGFFATPNNVQIGSNQTGGSSGGPWLVNFGTPPTTTTPLASENNQAVVATTSWGFNGGTVKIQGSSRFGHNSKFPATGNTNIGALVAAACAAFPTSC